MLRRILAIVRARLREFYRDRASLMWNLAMPILIVLGFAYIFDQGPDEIFKIGLVQGTVSSPMTEMRYLDFVPVDDLETAIEKVQRHQLDLLLDLHNPPRYWINTHSANGYLAERLMLQAYSQAPDPFVATTDSSRVLPARQTVTGSEVRYVDWLMPGVLAMNMMFSCLWGVGWVVVRYRKNGVLRRLQATPLTAFEFLTAQVLARLLTISVVTLVVFIGADLIIDFTMRGSHLLLALVFLAGAACLTSMGLVIATRLKTEELADGLLNLMSWPMMILSGVWFSLDGANPAAQALAQFLPLTHLVDAARQVMIDGAGMSAVWPQILYLFGLTFVLLLGSARLFRWN